MTELSASYEVIDTIRVNDYIGHRLQFKVPLDYDDSSRGDIVIVAQVVQKYTPAKQEAFLIESDRVILYLQGGPGGACATFSGGGYTKVLVDKGYVVVLMDQRGTGWSATIDAESLVRLVGDDVQDQFNYLLQFRAPQIIEDAEFIRRALLGKGKWWILGQSYGGFCSFTYLSKHADSIEASLITGGIPPVGHTADDVYTATYERCRERNAHFYKKYPADDARVRKICSYLNHNYVRLPNGGNLTVDRFQHLGIQFGATGGTDAVHKLVAKFAWELEQTGHPSTATLTAVQNSVSWGLSVIYALFQEIIYCDGPNSAPNWAAHRLRPSDFKYDAENAVYFTGEMVYPSMYEDYAELRPLKALAHKLMEYQSFLQLYSAKKLHANSVPIAAATYVHDQFVDFELLCRVKREVFQNNGNLKQLITSEYFHNGIGANPDRIVGALLDLVLKGEVD